MWRFSLYYVVVFGAYVAFSAYLPSYYHYSFGIDLWEAGLLAATFIFPASLLRPFGGWLSDKFGARPVMYATFFSMLIASGLLMMPNGHIVLHLADGSQKSVLPYDIKRGSCSWCSSWVAPWVSARRPSTSTSQRTSQERRLGRRPGGNAGWAGRLLPAAHVLHTQEATGTWSTAWAILFLFTLVSLLWMHWTIYRMHKSQSTHLDDLVEVPASGVPTAPEGSLS